MPAATIRTFRRAAKARQSRPRRLHRVDGNSFFDRPRWLYPQFELLECRAMLSVSQDLATAIAPYQSALTTALNVATQLPLVGHQLTALSELTTVLQNTQASIDTQTQSITANGHYQITVSLPGLSKAFSFNLGLDAFLQATAVGNVHADVNPSLTIGFDLTNGSAALDVGQTKLDIGFNISLPGFQGTFSLNGLLFTKAVDAGTSFSGDLGFNFASGNGLNAHFSGNAHVLMGLTLSFVDPALNASFNPTFKTTLDMNWGINNANNQLNIPSIQLKNFGLDIDSFMHGFFGDVVRTVQKFTKPIQPFVDVFETPVPILSAFGSSETIGTLILKGAGSSQAQQDSFSLMMQIINAVNSIDLSGNSGAVVSFGDINLTGDAQRSGFSFDTSAISGVIDDIENSPALQTVEDTLKDVGNYVGLTSTGGFKFPLLDNPGPVIGAILTGQIATMFSFSTGRQHFELAPSIGVGIKDLFGIFLSAGVVFDANLTMGYDTAGLIDYAAHSTEPQRLLHGFYFDNSIDTSVPPSPGPNPPTIRQTGLYLHGLMELSASAIVTVSGGLYANLSVELHSTDASSHVHLDSMISNLANGAKVFDLHGKLYASADLSLTFPNPLGPDITLFSFNLAYAELLNFDPPPPPTTSPPPVIIDVADQHTLLLDASKMGVGSHVVTVQPFHDLSVNIGGNTVVADGIRVDYPNEVDLYIERKDDFFRDYYNLIALSTTPPDGVSLNVIDPFRMFYDEGATIPYPPQTKPAVLLVGGKNVVYTYSEVADGTHPNVLLVGGFGSNSLTGGTMEYGNFIPASRVAQAHAHFGDISGFDGSGQSQINAQIANAVPPSNPAGIIGATLNASRGGLMFGGPGNNSFYATGPGAYEMVGGNWVNTFSISPSYNSVPATYQIDGGGGDSKLIVRVPSNEHVTFQNSTVVDKYDPTLKALDVLANAGLSATAHGIQKVHIVAVPGSRVEIGDTSEVNIDFSIEGAANLVFGGTNAPDVFNVTTSGDFLAQKNHYPVPTWMQFDANTIYVPAPGGLLLTQPYPDPVYTITRTFGTNGKTQAIPFSVHDADSSSISLDGKGASDTYNSTLGLGGFLDVTVDDSDAATQNSLTVNVRDLVLQPQSALLTDNALHLDYYTSTSLLGLLYLYGGTYYPFQPLPNGNFPTFGYSTASVHYSPTVRFGANVDITLASARLFKQTTINRPTAPQHASIICDFVGTISYYPYGTLTSGIFDAQAATPAFVNTSPIAPAMDILTNAGNLSIQNYEPSALLPLTTNVHSNTGTLALYGVQVWSGYVDTFNVLGNAGTLTIDYLTNGTFSTFMGYTGLTHNVNILANTGIINLHDVVHPALYPYGIDAQINVGNGNLAAIHGTINMANQNSHYGLNIDDRNNPGTAAAWTIDSTQTRVDDLTINYAGVNVPVRFADIFSHYQAFTKTGSAITLVNDPPFYFHEYNGTSAFPIPAWFPPTFLFNSDGDSVTASFAVPGAPAGLTYSATNLPPGLSINPTTGVVTGTIPLNSHMSDYYHGAVTVAKGLYVRSHNISWSVSSTINIFVPFDGALLGHEGVAKTLGPITTQNSRNQPVTLSVTGLPTGLAFNAGTGVISGTVAVGAAQNSPYHVNVHATDGVETSDYPFDWPVTGITLTQPQLHANHVGDVVNLAIQASTASGAALTFAADGLPSGLSINLTTGVITGTVATQASATTFFVTITATQGNDSQAVNFQWSVIPAGVTDELTLPNPGPQATAVDDFGFVNVSASSSLGLPISVSVQGLPTGLSLNTGEGIYIGGTIEASALGGSPFDVTITATDGATSVSQNFTWEIVVRGDFDRNNGRTPDDLTAMLNALADLPKYQSTRGLSNAAMLAMADIDRDGFVTNRDIQAMLDLLIADATGGGGGGGGGAAAAANFRVSGSLATPATVAIESMPATTTTVAATLPVSSTSDSVGSSMVASHVTQFALPLLVPTVNDVPSTQVSPRGIQMNNLAAVSSSIAVQAADNFYARLAIEQFERFWLDDFVATHPKKGADPWTTSDDSLGALSASDLLCS